MEGRGQRKPGGSAQTACLQLSGRHTELANVDCSLWHGALSKEIRWSDFKADVPKEDTHTCTLMPNRALGSGGGCSHPGRRPLCRREVVVPLSDSSRLLPGHPLRFRASVLPRQAARPACVSRDDSELGAPHTYLSFRSCTHRIKWLCPQALKLLNTEAKEIVPPEPLQQLTWGDSPPALHVLQGQLYLSRPGHSTAGPGSKTGWEAADTGATGRTRCSGETGVTYPGTSRKERGHLGLPLLPCKASISLGVGACSLVPNCRRPLPALPVLPVTLSRTQSRAEPSVATAWFTTAGTSHLAPEALCELTAAYFPKLPGLPLSRVVPKVPCSSLANLNLLASHVQFPRLFWLRSEILLTLRDGVTSSRELCSSPLTRQVISLL